MSAEHTSVRIISVALRILLVFVTYAALLVVTAGLLATAELVAAPAAVPQERDSLLGLPVVALASAGLTSFLVLRSRCSGSRLALRIGVTYFVAHTLLPELEAFGWSESLARRPGSAAISLFAGAVFATTLALASVVILGRAGPGSAAVFTPSPSRTRPAALAELTLALVPAALAYVAIYFGLGCSLGWYGAGPASANGEVGPLCLSRSATLLSTMPELWWVEAVRGCVWALVALTLARMLRGGVVEAAVVVGAFAALAGPVHSLLPSPTSVVHTLSTPSWASTVSHFAWGVLLAFWLSRRSPRFQSDHAENHAR